MANDTDILDPKRLELIRTKLFTAVLGDVMDARGLPPQPSPHFSYSEINALPLNGQQAVTAISALWLRRSTAFRWLQQPIGRHLMVDVVEQVIERHQEVKNEGISEGAGTDSGTSDGGQLGGGPGGNPGGARDDPDRGAEPVQYGFLAIPQHVRRSGRCRQAGRGRHRRA